MSKTNQQAAKMLSAAMGAEEESAAKEAREADEKRFQQMLKNMESTSDQGVSNSVLSGLIGMQSADISRMEGEMGTKTAIPAGMSAKQFEEEQHARKVESLQKVIASLKQKLLSQREPHSQLSQQLQEIEAI